MTWMGQDDFEDIPRVSMLCHRGATSERTAENLKLEDFKKTRKTTTCTQ